MGLIEEYEQQYSILTAEITSNISRLADSDIGVDISYFLLQNIFSWKIYSNRWKTKSDHRDQ